LEKQAMPAEVGIMSVAIEKLLAETRRVVTALGEAAEASVAEHGVSPRERRVLEFLNRCARGGPGSELARAQLLPVADVEATVRSLAQRGWVQVGEPPREPIVSLVAEGRSRWRALAAREQALLDDLDRALDEHTVRSALKTLRTLRRGLERCPSTYDDPRMRTLRSVVAR
jgi:DNA-binding MarR family transcriptional regulator